MTILNFVLIWVKNEQKVKIIRTVVIFFLFQDIYIYILSIFPSYAA